MDVAIGIDSHKASVCLGAVDPLGRTKAVKQFSNNKVGHRAALIWIRAQGSERIVGVEGSGFYGAALTRALIAAGEQVKEVPASLTFGERRKAPSRGKSDPVDALAIARVTARGDGLAEAKMSGVYEDLKLLSDHRDQLVSARTETMNRIHADLVHLCPGYQEVIPNLKSQRRVARVKTMIRRDRSVRADLVRERVDELNTLTKRIRAVEARLQELVAASNTTLTSLPGVGVVVAAKILGEVGDPKRMRSRAAFAMFNGTAPIEASSGNTKRHRLNRGGNRQLNFALHIVATAQRRSHPETKDYIARRLAEGKTSREAMRCLKRHLSNVLYRELARSARLDS